MLCYHCYREQIKSKSRRLKTSTPHACSPLPVQRFGKPMLRTSGCQKMVSPSCFQTPSHSSGKRRELAIKRRCGWWMGCSLQTQGSPILSVYSCLCKTEPNKIEEGPAETITRETDAHSYISHSRNLFTQCGNGSTEMHGKHWERPFQQCESLSPVSAPVTLRTEQPLGRADV